ncbi:MAG TPA: 50S ribosomal protein L22 [Synergistaceae bacterium]|jgi:large subunit ribosomal protein L22|nr:50S ribosomal protein L22 [Synergistaceae bacterium]HPX03741.1 50S ribosomal protein L22 [Synergistaceae bacterium]HQA54639.1 50S ribosomal protein L22 [Synergistaceae bacterium]
MEVKATARQVRISATKVRQVLALIRGKKASDALLILKYTPNKGARVAEKVLKSAIANAEHNYGLDMDKLVVKEVMADQGSYMKRFRPVSMGRAHAFRHHTCHVSVVVCEK